MCRRLLIIAVVGFLQPVLMPTIIANAANPNVCAICQAHNSLDANTDMFSPSNRYVIDTGNIANLIHHTSIGLRDNLGVQRDSRTESTSPISGFYSSPCSYSNYYLNCNEYQFPSDYGQFPAGFSPSGSEFNTKFIGPSASQVFNRTYSGSGLSGGTDFTQAGL